MEKFKEQFPEFQLEDELLREEGRNVVDQHWGIPYQRRSRKEGSGVTPASKGNHEIEESRSESV
jgi:hypothetical protein